MDKWKIIEDKLDKINLICFKNYSKDTPEEIISSIEIELHDLYHAAYFHGYEEGYESDIFTAHDEF